VRAAPYRSVVSGYDNYLAQARCASFCHYNKFQLKGDYLLSRIGLYTRKKSQASPNNRLWQISAHSGCLPSFWKLYPMLTLRALVKKEGNN
jgi:hypothetical protein